MNTAEQTFIRRMRQVRALIHQMPARDWKAYVRDMIDLSAPLAVTQTDDLITVYDRFTRTAETETGLNLSVE